jgi:hypothetical protein
MQILGARDPRRPVATDSHGGFQLSATRIWVGAPSSVGIPAATLNVRRVFILGDREY